VPATRAAPARAESEGIEQQASRLAMFD